MTDLTKSNNYQLLCEILGLCIETGTLYYCYPNIGVLRLKGGDLIYRFTLDTPSPELEQAKQDLINYKYQTKQENNVRQETTNRI